jgi:hypothetical protein
MIDLLCMKTKFRYMALALTGSAFLWTTQADKLRLNQLPLEVRDKIQAHSGSNQIEDIDRQNRDGRVTYQVAFKESGQHKELLFDDKGQLLNADGTASVDSRKITFAELPEAVKHMVETRTKKEMVNDIDRQVKDGRINYEIGFKQDAQQQELVISEDGRIIKDVPSAPGTGTTTIAGTGAPADNLNLWRKAVTLSESKKVSFSELPAPVAKAIVSASNGARIEDVEKGNWRGQTLYEAAFKEQGQHIEVQVREDGRIFYDPRNTRIGRSAAGGPAAGAVQRGSSLYADVTAPVELSSGEKVDRRSVPAAVSRTMMQQAGSAPIEDIERGSWRGTTVYQVAFKDNGQHVELQIDEKGNIVFDPRTGR